MGSDLILGKSVLWLGSGICSEPRVMGELSIMGTIPLWSQLTGAKNNSLSTRRLNGPKLKPKRLPVSISYGTWRLVLRQIVKVGERIGVIA